MKSLLIINAGSSSLKFATFNLPLTEGAPSVFRGQVDGIGANAQFVAKDVDGKKLIETAVKTRAGSDLEEQHQDSLNTLFNWLDEQKVELAAVGHRVVHGGEKFSAPVQVTPEVLQQLTDLTPLAPLHQPHNVRPIRTLAERFPDLPQVACFDTAFHRTQPKVAQTYAIPRKYTDEGVKRYGFHGQSYEYIARQLPKVVGEQKARGAVVVAHLGNGASMAAMRDLKGVATTMGFTACDGLMMGTRTGAVDPGILLYLVEKHKFDAKQLSNFMYKESGLLGVSGMSQDMRTLESSDAPEAKEALDLFIYRVAREIGSLAVAAGGLDTLVYTGGIGENSDIVRREVAKQLAWLGMEIDETLNNMRGKTHTINTPNSKVTVAVIPTNEEWMIAHHTTSLLKL